MKFYLLLLFFFSNVHKLKCTFTYETKSADVQIDHFSYTRNDTFKLRYLINDTYWSADGPIFFYTGNEGDIELFAKNTGFMVELAPKFNALIVFCEHRFYGTSLPFGSQSYNNSKNLGYLTSEQALNDFVDVIDILQKKYGSDGNLPVIAFGGSYGGMLAAWIRIKYPASVLGAIAASAPILQFTDITPCDRFYSIVAYVYGASDESIDCRIPFKNLWPTIKRITNTPEGLTWLNGAWKLCKNLTNQDDVDALIDDISNAIVNVAMANYPYPNDFLAVLPAYPVKMICSKLRNYETFLKNDTLFLINLGEALSVYTNYSGKATCNDFGTTASLDTNGWDFQSCTEMVMPMCSKNNNMFEDSSWDYQSYAKGCLDKFGVKPPNPEEVVLRYGGNNLKYTSNIVFSNGLLDPWSGGGVISNISSTVSAVIIPEGAHHLDLRWSNPADPPSVIKARNFHYNAINSWLDDYYNKENSHKVLRVK